MNLSRDFLERGVRAKRLAEHWRETLEGIDWPCTVVANADDPLVAWAVRGARDIVWVAGEDAFDADGLLCRDCLVKLDKGSPPHWSCPRCGVERPHPPWSLRGSELVGPDGAFRVDSVLPGHASRINALFGVAAAEVMGVPPEEALVRMAGVENVDGRYLPHRFGNHTVRVLLAKNPASWTESIATVREAVDADPDSSVVLAMASRGSGGGQDTAMLWDAPFEDLVGLSVVTAGNRGDELALRLAAAGVDVERSGADVVEAITGRPEGAITLIANWPAFNAVLDRIGRG
jgi:UDP-N-acetylmuramyl tripeptide synthase